VGYDRHHIREETTLINSARRADWGAFLATVAPTSGRQSRCLANFCCHPRNAFCNSRIALAVQWFASFFMANGLTPPLVEITLRRDLFIHKPHS
jgi:hypothetical protein